jgi:isopenicillin-N N-acyltransferase-like protein
MMRRAAGVALCCVLGCLAAAGCQMGSAPLRLAEMPMPDATVPQHAFLEAPADVFPTPIVILSGDADEIGSEHGRKLAEPIRLLHDRYLGALLHNAPVRLLALLAAEKFESRFRPEHREELTALAKGAGLEEREAALEQCFLDLLPMTACSTVSLPPAASPDGVARFGRNLDFPSFGVADRYSTVFVYHPKGRYAFASIGWPGLMGVLSGMNEHGLAVANMEVDRMPCLPEAMPYTLLYRTILERCRTTDEAIELLRTTPRQTSNNLMIMDASGDRAVAEITPGGVTVRRVGADAALISTNHQRGIDVDSAGRCERYDFLHDQSKQDFGRIDVRRLEQMLAGASPGSPTMQSMVFQPKDRVIYLSACSNAANGTFHRLDLKPYFDGLK